MVEAATGILRELQLTEAETLSQIKRICEKYGLTYYLVYGTLLGAVRHQGFIPWYDDIDIALPYTDYVRFLEVAQKELGEGYFLQTSDTEVNYYRSYARVRKNGTTLMDKYQQGWDVHHGVFVDVFPLVEMNPGIEWKIKRNIVRVSNYIIMDNYFLCKEDEFVDKMGKIGVGLVKAFHKLPRSSRLKFKKWLLKCVYTAKNKKGKAIVWMGVTEVIPKETYEQTDILLFEGEAYPVASGYKAQLTQIYGDYMQLPPVEKRRGHGVETIIDLERDYTFYLQVKM